jgi:hypothetical protein
MSQQAAASNRPSASGRIWAGTVQLVYLFLIDLIPRKWCKLPKFVEACRNAQKWQNKFCMNTLEPLYTVGLTKLIFMQ